MAPLETPPHTANTHIDPLVSAARPRSTPTTSEAALEPINTATHALGLVLALVGSAFLLQEKSLQINASVAWGCTLYAAGLISAYASSCLYHSARDPEWKAAMRVLDQICIYLLIGGTATPVFLKVLPGALGLQMILAVWAIGLSGIALRLGFPNRFDGVSILLYLAMSWCGAFALESFVPEAPEFIKPLIIGGGIAFTTGLLFYLSEPFFRWGHVIWHVFVLLGSGLHFAAVLTAIR